MIPTRRERMFETAFEAFPSAPKVVII